MNQTPHPQDGSGAATDSIGRRRFVKATAVTTAGLAASSLVAGVRAAEAAGKETSSMSSNKGVIFKSVKFGMIGINGSYADKFKALKDLGFDGVEFDSPSGHKIQDVREAAEKVGLPIHGVVDSTHWKIRLSSPDAAVRERGLQDLLTAIRDSHALGGNAVLLVPGHGRDGTPEAVAKRSIEQIRKALPLAARLGQRILIENVWNQFLYQHGGPADQSADLYAGFIDQVGSPWVGAYFDIGNHRKYGVPSQWAKTLGKRLVKIDVKDYDHKADKWAGIGQGTVDWENLRGVLKDIGFTGWATAEVGGGDVNRLKQIAQRMDDVLGL